MRRPGYIRRYRLDTASKVMDLRGASRADYNNVLSDSVEKRRIQCVGVKAFPEGKNRVCAALRARVPRSLYEPRG